MCCCCLALPQPKARVLRVFQNSCWNSKQHKRNYVYELHSYCLKACGVCTASFSAQPRSNRRCTTYQPLRCYHGSFNRAEDLRDSDPTFNRRQHDQSAGPHDTCCHLLNFAYSAPHCSGYSCESSEPFPFLCLEYCWKHQQLFGEGTAAINQSVQPVAPQHRWHLPRPCRTTQ